MRAPRRSLRSDPNRSLAARQDSFSSATCCALYRGAPWAGRMGTAHPQGAAGKSPIAFPNASFLRSHASYKSGVRGRGGVAPLGLSAATDLKSAPRAAQAHTRIVEAAKRNGSAPATAATHVEDIVQQRQATSRSPCARRAASSPRRALAKASPSMGCTRYGYRPTARESGMRVMCVQGASGRASAFHPSRLRALRQPAYLA